MGGSLKRALTGSVLAGIADLALAACGSSDGNNMGSLAASTGATAAATSTTQAASKGTVNIDPLTGPLSYLGSLKSAQAAVDAIDDAGGVNGHRINMKSYDMGATSGGAVAAVRQAVQDKPLAVLGATAASIDAVKTLIELGTEAHPSAPPVEFGNEWLYHFESFPVRLTNWANA